MKELKSLALELGIDTSKCIGKSDLVRVIKNIKNEEAAEDHYENATNEKATLNQYEKKKEGVQPRFMRVRGTVVTL